MATIIAAKLQLQAQAEEAIQQLVDSGFPEDKIALFYVNPPGQHAAYPIGGDRFQSPGMGKPDANAGYVARVAEAVMGIAIKPSHVDMPSSQHDHHEVTNETNEAVPVRRAGIMVAAEVTECASQDNLIKLLTKLGAHEIEAAEGDIVNGQWTNFDPLSQPHYVGQA